MLAFRRLDIIVAHPGFAPDGNASVLVCWEIITQHRGLDKTTFRVERSLSPQFVAEDITVLEADIPGAPGQLVYEYDDVTPNLISWWRRYYYRVVASTPDGEVSSALRTWESNPRMHELAIIERHDYVLKFLQGSPSFAFVERTAEAAICSCVNPTTRRPSDSRCTLCLGTGRQRPYFEPIPIFVDYNPDQKMISISNMGERHPNEKDCWTSAYPQLKPGDILFELLPGVLWRISTVHTIQPQGTTIQHICRLSVVDRDQIEYQRLPQQISSDVRRTLVQEWERIKEERMF